MNTSARLKQHFFHITRFILQADSAFSIASGLSDAAFDNLVVRDANHLPAIPATTLAGVLRHMYRLSYADASDDELFGYQDKDKGAISRVEFSWGVIHDSDNQPVETLLDRITDPLLERLAQDHPVYRDRVRINSRGTADHQAKYDLTVIPKGCRFSFEMSLWADQHNPHEWQRLLKLINSPHLRLGAAVRSGLGQFSCIQLHEKIFDLTDAEHYQAFATLKPGLAETDDWEDKTDAIEGETAKHSLTLSLQPEDFWRFGQGHTPLKNTAKAADALPYVEPVIRWSEAVQGDEEKPHTASLDRDYVVVPGSAVKGVIRHRFFYHYARQVLHRDDAEALAQKATDTVFGFAADSEAGHTTGQAGMVYFSDCYIDVDTLRPNVVQMTHTSIDRFTGGVRYGVLYMEELIWRHPLKLGLAFDAQASEQFDDRIATALQWTLDDLTEGRLALGAASSKGHGYFQGVQEWQQKPAWLSAQTKQQEVAA